MNPLHLKVEQNKQVKQLWSGATHILKRSEQPHSGQLIGGSFLKKTLMEGDRKWNWMNERKKNATFFVSFEEKLIHGKINRKTASILETSGLDRFRLQLRSGLFNAIMPGWQFQHVWKNGKMDQIHTSYKYPPIKRSKFSCCDFNLLYRCIAAFSWYCTKSGSVFSFWTVPAINSWGLESWRNSLGNSESLAG